MYRGRTLFDEFGAAGGRGAGTRGRLWTALGVLAHLMRNWKASGRDYGHQCALGSSSFHCLQFGQV